MSYEYYSSLALVIPVVVYALAMFAHAAEWAAARRLRRCQACRSRVGGCCGGGTQRRADAPGAPSTCMSSRCRAAGLAADSEAEPTAAVEIERFGQVDVALTVIGFVLGGIGVLTQGLAAQRAPWNDMFEFTITAMVFVVGCT